MAFSSAESLRERAKAISKVDLMNLIRARVGWVGDLLRLFFGELQ